MKTIAALIFLTLFSSCTKSIDDEPQQQANLAVGIDIGIRNANGEDLLNPSNPNSYKADNIKLYYLINGKKIEINDPKMATPRNFIIYEKDGEYRIGVTQNYSETESLPITYIEWNPNETDTLQAEVYRNGGLIRSIKTWFNGELMWDAESETEPFFTIIK